MNTDINTGDESKYRFVGPCSLTHLFLREKSFPNTYWIDAYKQPYETLIFEYKAALQKLQLSLLEEMLDNSVEIGHYFQKLEDRFEKIIANFLKD